MTIMEHVVGGETDSNLTSDDFDPLAEFAGAWNTRLAQHYSTWLNSMFGKWESVEGRLLVAPFEASSNSWGESTLVHLLRDAAHKAGYFVYGCLNLGVSVDTWLQPDVSVLHKVPGQEDKRMVPADHFTMPIEFVSPSSRRRDRIEKAAILEAVGVPYYMLVEIDARRRQVSVEQRKLAADGWAIVALASTKQVFTMTEPFEVSFDVSELLEPEA